METYPTIDDKSGRVLDFEIDNIYVNNSNVARILSKVDGVAEVRLRKLFSDGRKSIFGSST